MARFEDTPGLFGNGSGASTSAEIHCDLCHTTYNVGKDGDGQEGQGDSVCHVFFCGLEICDCCFEKIERAVLMDMGEIIPWYTRILEARAKEIRKSFGQLGSLKQALEKVGGQ